MLEVNGIKVWQPEARSYPGVRDWGRLVKRDVHPQQKQEIKRKFLFLPLPNPSPLSSQGGTSLQPGICSMGTTATMCEQLWQTSQKQREAQPRTGTSGVCEVSVQMENSEHSISEDNNETK